MNRGLVVELFGHREVGIKNRNGWASNSGGAGRIG
jgi:hypothetical protein